MTSLRDSASLAIDDAAAGRAAALHGLASRAARAARTLPWPVVAIALVAAWLRFTELEDVQGNLFYDAAVRSMGMSWHNFFYGAFDPGGILSVDKAPLDLWLQVASVKLFGWNAAALKLPEALGGTLAVPLLYDAVRRVAGEAAGLGAAMVLAVLPESVLTSRSDTMDSVMMLLVIAAFWFVVRAAQSGRRRQLVLGGVMLGLAFNVKLFEALIGAPALVVLYALGSAKPWRQRLSDLTLAAGALVAVGLAWATAASIAPGRHPWPIGSTDGSVWNVMFVFNGFGRVANPPIAGAPGGPGVLRLFQSNSWQFDTLFGNVLIAAAAIGGLAVLSSVARRGKVWSGGPYWESSSGSMPPIARAFSIALFVWLIVSYVLFSHIATVHTRYLEAAAPALAAAVGLGAASLAGLAKWRRNRGVPSVAFVAIALACVCAYSFTLRSWSIAWGAGAMSIAAVGAALIGRSGGRLGYAAQWLTAILVVATTSLFPIHESVRLVHAKASNSTGLKTYSPQYEAKIWSYLEPRTAGTKYELAVDEPIALSPLILHERRPILPLTSFKGIPAVPLSELRAAVDAGEVRYALIGVHVCRRVGDTNAACVPAARWVLRHGIDVSAAAGIGGKHRLYQLLPA